MQETKNGRFSRGRAEVRAQVKTRESCQPFRTRNHWPYPAGGEYQGSNMDRSAASEDSAHVHCPRAQWKLEELSPAFRQGRTYNSDSHPLLSVPGNLQRLRPYSLPSRPPPTPDPNAFDPLRPPPKKNTPEADSPCASNCHFTSTMTPPFIPSLRRGRSSNQQHTNRRHNCSAPSGIQRPGAGCDVTPRTRAAGPQALWGQGAGLYPSGPPPGRSFRTAERKLLEPRDRRLYSILQDYWDDDFCHPLA